MKLFTSLTYYDYMNEDFQIIALSLGLYFVCFAIFQHKFSKLLHEVFALQLHVQTQTPAHLELLNNGQPFC